MDWTRAGPPTQRTTALKMKMSVTCILVLKGIGMNVRPDHLQPHRCASLRHGDSRVYIP